MGQPGGRGGLLAEGGVPTPETASEPGGSGLHSGGGRPPEAEIAPPRRPSGDPGAGPRECASLKGERDSDEGDSMRPPASVLISARGAGESLGQVLRALLPQVQAQAAELLVVGEGGAEPLLGRSEEFPRCVQFVPAAPVAGRGAALNRALDRARGELLIELDSDVLPGPNWLAEHLQFHERHPAPTATHLGELSWPTEPARQTAWLPALLGPRGKPRLLGCRGQLPWTLWSIDNWSAKRELFEAPAERFIEGGEHGAFDELDLVLRWVERGATCELSGKAAGQCLRTSNGLDLLHQPRRSAEHLRHLQARYPERPELSSWMSVGYASAAALEAGERFLEELLELANELFAGGERLDDHPALKEQMGSDFARALFQVGLARGLWDAGLDEPCELRESSDADHALDLAAIAAPIYLTGALFGQEQRVAAGIEGALGRLAQTWSSSSGFLQELTGRVDFEFQSVLELVHVAA